MNKEQMRRYGGYVNAIKNEESNTQFCFVETDSPMKAVSLLMEQCKKEYPANEGWHSHCTSQAEIYPID